MTDTNTKTIRLTSSFSGNPEIENVTNIKVGYANIVITVKTDDNNETTVALPRAAFETLTIVDGDNEYPVILHGDNFRRMNCITTDEEYQSVVDEIAAEVAAVTARAKKRMAAATAEYEAFKQNLTPAEYDAACANL